MNQLKNQGIETDVPKVPKVSKAFFSSKDEVLAWIGDRGICVEPKTLKKWCWLDGVLYFVIQGGDEYEILNTEPGMVDLVHTHSEDGRSNLYFEISNSIPIAESPFSK